MSPRMANFGPEIQPALFPSEKPKSSASLQGAAQFERTLNVQVQKVNESMASNITGASLLGDQFKSALAEIKTAITKTQGEMTAALSDLKDTAGQASGMVAQIKQESAQLKAALGLSTNNPPSS